ncbi:MAG: hypothetical protein K8R36_14845 [Planctomycetales bacterium]|nr:hypothetical protein [Planctomycetales bacterium]
MPFPLRFSIRTLFLAITLIALLLALGLPWLRKRATIILGTLGAETIPNVVELDPQKQAQQEVADMERRKSNTRRWMTKQGFRLISDISHTASDRFTGELPNCGETKVKVNYHTDPADLNIEVEANLPFWVWESSPVVPREMYHLLDEVGVLVEVPKP